MLLVSHRRALTDNTKCRHKRCCTASPANMLLTRLILLPFAVASTVTLYVSSVPATEGSAVAPSAIPLAQIEYDADQAVGTLASYTPPTGSYSDDHLLRVGLTDSKTGSWRGIVTSASSFADQYHKKFTIHVDEKGEPFHVGFGTSAKSAGKEVEIEIVKRSPGPKPVLNKPVVLNAEGKLESKEPEKTFLQKYVKSSVHGFDKITNTFVGTGGLSRSSLSYSWYLAEGRANRSSENHVDKSEYDQAMPRPYLNMILYASSLSTSSPPMTPWM